MAAAPSCTWVDCPAVWGWTMILHWQGTQHRTQPRLILVTIDSTTSSKLNLINRSSIKRYKKIARPPGWLGEFFCC
jgi:hypothetical protein